MIISEKQIMQLIALCHAYIDTLKTLSDINKISEASQVNLNVALNVLNTIYNQQSEELKEIK